MFFRGILVDSTEYVYLCIRKLENAEYYEEVFIFGAFVAYDCHYPDVM